MARNDCVCVLWCSWRDRRFTPWSVEGNSEAVLLCLFISLPLEVLCVFVMRYDCVVWQFGHIMCTLWEASDKGYRDISTCIERRGCLFLGTRLPGASVRQENMRSAVQDELAIGNIADCVRSVAWFVVHANRMNSSVYEELSTLWTLPQCIPLVVLWSVLKSCWAAPKITSGLL